MRSMSTAVGPTVDWSNNASWKYLKVMPGKELVNGRAVGNPDANTSASYDSVKANFVSMLKVSGTGGGEIRLSKVASLARRSSAQKINDDLSATGQGIEIAACALKLSSSQASTLALCSSLGAAEVSLHGRWGGHGSSRHCVESYLLDPSPSATRVQAGFDPRGGDHFEPELAVLPARAVWRLLVPGLAEHLTAQEALPPDSQVCVASLCAWLVALNRKLNSALFDCYRTAIS